MFDKFTTTVTAPFHTLDGRVFMHPNREYESVFVGSAQAVMTEVGPVLMWRNGRRVVSMPIDLIYEKLGIEEMLDEA